MNNITVPFNADQTTYYAVFGRSDNGEYVQCSEEYDGLQETVEVWRGFIKQLPEQSFGVYQVLISQLYIPESN
jgi:hypothetical protein